MQNNIPIPETYFVWRNIKLFPAAIGGKKAARREPGG